MSNVFENRVLEVSTSSGTGPFTLAGAVLGYRAFTEVCAVSDTVPYYIEAVDDQGRPTGEWEFGLGTYSAANQLTRTTVRGSSNSGLAVSFAAGTKVVGLGVPAPNSSATRSEWRSALGFTSFGESMVTAASGAVAQALLPVNQARVDVASAATVNLTSSAPNSDHINITGTTAITGFTVAAGRLLFVRFNASLTLTDGASLVTQRGVNIVTQAGDTCILRATAANVVEILSYREARWDAFAGAAPLFACRAWVNFNGTDTVAIRASGNVSSVTDNGTGDYTINFATAMPDADYGTQLTGLSHGVADGRASLSIHGAKVSGPTLYTTSAVRIYSYQMAANAAANDAMVCVAIFR